MERGWERAVLMLPSDPSPPPETALKLSLAIAVLACADMETKALGAGTAPAFGTGKQDNCLLSQPLL